MPSPQSNWIIYGGMAFDPVGNIWHDLSTGESYPVYGGILASEGSRGSQTPVQRIQAAAKAAGIVEAPSEATASAESGDATSQLPDANSPQNTNAIGIPEGDTRDFPSSSAVQDYASALSDYWNAVDQYGEGGFGYDANGDVVPYPGTGDTQVETPTARGGEPIVEVPTDRSSGELVTGDYNQAVQDYWDANEQYGDYGVDWQYGGPDGTDIIPIKSSSSGGPTSGGGIPVGRGPMSTWQDYMAASSGFDPGKSAFSSKGTGTVGGVGPQFSSDGEPQMSFSGSSGLISDALSMMVGAGGGLGSRGSAVAEQTGSSLDQALGKWIPKGGSEEDFYANYAAKIPKNRTLGAYAVGHGGGPHLAEALAGGYTSARGMWNAIANPGGHGTAKLAAALAGPTAPTRG